MKSIVGLEIKFTLVVLVVPNGNVLLKDGFEFLIFCPPKNLFVLLASSRCLFPPLKKHILNKRNVELTIQLHRISAYSFDSFLYFQISCFQGLSKARSVNADPCIFETPFRQIKK
jgi:hypothetical protein